MLPPCMLVLKKSEPVNIQVNALRFHRRESLSHAFADARSSEVGMVSRSLPSARSCDSDTVS